MKSADAARYANIWPSLAKTGKLIPKWDQCLRTAHALQHHYINNPINLAIYMQVFFSLFFFFFLLLFPLRFVQCYESLLLLLLPISIHYYTIIVLLLLHTKSVLNSQLNWTNCICAHIVPVCLCEMRGQSVYISRPRRSTCVRCILTTMMVWRGTKCIHAIHGWKLKSCSIQLIEEVFHCTVKRITTMILQHIYSLTHKHGV